MNIVNCHIGMYNIIQFTAKTLLYLHTIIEKYIPMHGILIHKVKMYSNSVRIFSKSSKIPYITLNDKTYILLRIQELRNCKHIDYHYFYEELFVVNSKAKYSHESVWF